MTRNVRYGRLVAVVIAVLALLLAVLYLNNCIGVSKAGLEKDLRGDQRVPEDWIVTGEVSDTLAAFLAHPADLSDHTFSVYVDRPGLSFGYFFRSGGSLSGVETGIAQFTLEGSPETAFLSMNQAGIARVEIDDGDSVSVIQLDSRSPFALVLPTDQGTIRFYDVSGAEVQPWEHPL